MNDAPDITGSPAVANLWDSQITDPNANPGTPSGGNPGNPPQGGNPAATVQAPAGDTVNNGQANPQNPQGSQDQTVARLNGQIATLQRQIQQMQRQTTRQPANPNGANPNGGQPGGDTPQTYTPEQFNFALNAVEGQVRRGLEARLSLYDGSNPAYKDQGNLTPDEVMLVRSNPYAFCKMETILSGDEVAILDEIETRIAAIAASRAAKPGTPGTPVNTPPVGQTPQGMQVNPSPIPAPDANNPNNGKPDFWSMPIEDLKKYVAQNRPQQ